MTGPPPETACAKSSLCRPVPTCNRCMAAASAAPRASTTEPGDAAARSGNQRDGIAELAEQQIQDRIVAAGEPQGLSAAQHRPGPGGPSSATCSRLRCSPVTTPASRSRRYARATVLAAHDRRSARTRTDGNRSPGANRPTAASAANDRASSSTVCMSTGEYRRTTGASGRPSAHDLWISPSGQRNTSTSTLQTSPVVRCLAQTPAAPSSSGEWFATPMPGSGARHVGLPVRPPSAVWTSRGRILPPGGHSA